MEGGEGGLPDSNPTSLWPVTPRGTRHIRRPSACRRAPKPTTLPTATPGGLQAPRPSEMPRRRQRQVCGVGGLYVALALLLAAADVANAQGMQLGGEALAAGENAAAGKLLDLEEMLELSDSYTGRGGGGKGGSGGGRGRGRSSSSGVTSTLRRQVQAAQFVAAAPLVYDSSNASVTPDGLNRLPLVRNQGECSTCVGMAVAAAVEAAIGAAVSATNMSQLQLSGPYLYYCIQSPRTCFTGWNLIDALELVKQEPDALLREPGCMPAGFSDSSVLYRREVDAACNEAASACNSKPPLSLGQMFDCTYEALSSFQAIQQAIRINGGAVVTRMTLFDDTRAAVAANPTGVYRPGPGARKQEGHAVLLTGYDNVNFTWSVLSSWGSDFGVGGVFKVAMDAGTGLGTPEDTYTVSCSPKPGANLTSINAKPPTPLVVPANPHDVNATTCVLYTATKHNCLADIARMFGLRDLGAVATDNPQLFPAREVVIAYSDNYTATDISQLKTQVCAEANASSSRVLNLACTGADVTLAPSGAPCDAATSITLPADASGNAATLVSCNATRIEPDLSVMGDALEGQQVKLCGLSRAVAAALITPGTKEALLYELLPYMRQRGMYFFNIPAGCGWDIAALSRLGMMRDDLWKSSVSINCNEQGAITSVSTSSHPSSLSGCNLYWTGSKAFVELLAKHAAKTLKSLQVKCVSETRQLADWASLPPTLEVLDLEYAEYAEYADCVVGGGVPGSWRQLTNLTTLRVAGPRCTQPRNGTQSMPWDLLAGTTLPRLRSLTLRNLQLRGDVYSLNRLGARVEHVDFGGNQLSGPLPFFFSQVQVGADGRLNTSMSLATLDLSDNNITGSIPAATGTNPVGWPALLPNLKLLNVSNTLMTGCNPFPGPVLSASRTNITSACGGNDVSPEEQASQRDGLRRLAEMLVPSDGHAPLAQCKQVLLNIASTPGAFNVTALCGTSFFGWWHDVDACPSHLRIICHKRQPDSQEVEVRGLQLQNVNVTSLAGLGGVLQSFPFLKWFSCRGCTPTTSSGNRLGAVLAGGRQEVHNATLQQLVLVNCHLTGQLPQAWPSWAQGLSFLDLSQNRLSGDLPVNLPSQLPSITYTDVSRNRLSGRLPASWGAVSQWQRRTMALYLAANDLAGPIPSTWAPLLAAALFVDLRGNPRLSGCLVPAAVKSTTVDAHIGSCAGEGSPIVQALRSLQAMLDPQRTSWLVGAWVAPPNGTSTSNSAYHCSWRGVRCDAQSGVIGLDLSSVATSSPGALLKASLLTAALSKLSSVQNLSLVGNGLAGQLPARLAAAAPNLQHLDLSRNRLDGPLPLAWKALHKLVHLDVSSNSINGTLGMRDNPQLFVWPALQALRVLNASHNRLTGSLPAGLGLLGGLTTLDLSHNRLSGDLPGVWADAAGLQPAAEVVAAGARPPVGLEQLVTLNLQHNRLRGSIPADRWRRLASLQVLQLQGNAGLSGPLPPLLASLSQLQVLDVSGCGFSGPLPGQWVRLTQLRTLKAARNAGVRGTLTPSWAGLSVLQEVDLRNCSIGGRLPPEWASLQQATAVRLAHNRLVGTLPFAYARLANRQTSSRLLLDVSGNKGLRGCVPYPLLGSSGVLLRLSNTNVSRLAATPSGTCCIANSAVINGITCQRCAAGQQPTADMTACAGPPQSSYVDETYCNPDNDYDLQNPDDWDAMKQCCKDAKSKGIKDSDCDRLPPNRPPEKPPSPPPDTPTMDDDYCMANDYDLTNQGDRDLWVQCCADAVRARVQDPDCERQQW